MEDKESDWSGWGLIKTQNDLAEIRKNASNVHNTSQGEDNDK